MRVFLRMRSRYSANGRVNMNLSYQRLLTAIARYAYLQISYLYTKPATKASIDFGTKPVRVSQSGLCSTLWRIRFVQRAEVIEARADVARPEVLAHGRQLFELVLPLLQPAVRHIVAAHVNGAMYSLIVAEWPNANVKGDTLFSITRQFIHRHH
jgi:hypothetical protein